MGRFYQERMGGNPQTVITTKITPGIDGREKQSKSLGNYIAVSDTPRDMFGKAMSLADNLIAEFLEVYTLVPIEKICQMDAAMRAGDLNPMEAKRALGQALVERTTIGALRSGRTSGSQRCSRVARFPKMFPLCMWPM